MTGFLGRWLSKANDSGRPNADQVEVDTDVPSTPAVSMKARREAQQSSRAKTETPNV